MLQVPIDVPNPHEGYTPTLEDIGAKIKLEYIPVREDWVSGKPEVRSLCSASRALCPRAPPAPHTRAVGLSTGVNRAPQKWGGGGGLGKGLN